jgi:hypothetical protein
MRGSIVCLLRRLRRRDNLRIAVANTVSHRYTKARCAHPSAGTATAIRHIQVIDDQMSEHISVEHTFAAVRVLWRHYWQPGLSGLVIRWPLLKPPHLGRDGHAAANRLWPHRPEQAEHPP